MGQKKSKQQLFDIISLPTLPNINEAAIRRFRGKHLREIIDIDDGLLPELLICYVLDNDQVERIESERTPIDRTQQLLREMRKKTTGEKKQFLSVLKKVHQSHVVNYIIEKGRRRKTDDQSWPLVADSLWSTIDQNWSRLVEMIDSSDEFLLRLRLVRCITIRQEQRVNRLQSSPKRSEELLNILKRRSIRNFNDFINCLLKFNQYRVVSLLEPIFGGDDLTNQLTHEQLDRLFRTSQASKALIDTNGTNLLQELYNVGGVHERQIEQLRASNTSADVNIQLDQLMDILKCGSQLTLIKFIRSLNRTGQEHVSELLLKGDGTVEEFIAKTSLNDCDKELAVERFNNRTTKSPEFKRRINRINKLFRKFVDGCRLIALKKDNSIKLFILCESLIGLWNLHRMYCDGQFKQIVEQAFTLLLDDEETVSVDTLSWEKDHYTNHAQCLSELMGLPKFATLYQLTRQTPDIPPNPEVFFSLEQLQHKANDLLEMLLIKTAGHLFVIGSKITDRVDIYLFVMLSSVCHHWWKTLTGEKYISGLVKRHFERVFQPYKFNAELVSTIDLPSPECIVEFNGKLYVKQHKNRAIQVFSTSSSDNYKREDEIKLPERNVNSTKANIIVCDYTRYLFIMEYDFEERHARCIWRVTVTSGNKFETFISSECPVGNMSVRCGRLLVTSISSEPKAVFHYNEDGQLNKRIILPKDMSNALYSLETVNDTFLVSYASSRTSVRELSDEGLVLREFSGTVRLSRPNYLTFDGNDRILVADDRTADKQIILLNSNLELERVLLTIPVDEPFHRLLFSHQTGNLYVCHPTRTNVYKLASVDCA